MPHRCVDIDNLRDVSSWPEEEERPAGRRPKALLYDPAAGSAFIFKRPRQERDERAQVWSELVASFIAGDLLELDVQRVALGVSANDLGNLLTLVFEDGETFQEGEQWLTRLKPDYEIKVGTDHTLSLAIAGAEAAGVPEDEVLEFWAKTIAFDCLISNSDRHQENWAIIRGRDGRARMAPLFDNAGSLGAQVDEATLRTGWFDWRGRPITSKFAKHARKGAHHLRLVAGGPKTPFAQLCSHFCNTYPDYDGPFVAFAEADLAPVADFLAEIQAIRGLPHGTELSSQRAAQFLEVLRLGQERLKNAL